MTQFNKSNLITHIQSRLDEIEAKHGERIKGLWLGIDSMLPCPRKDELMRAWGAWHELNDLLTVIKESSHD